METPDEPRWLSAYKAHLLSNMPDNIRRHIFPEESDNKSGGEEAKMKKMDASPLLGSSSGGEEAKMKMDDFMLSSGNDDSSTNNNSGGGGAGRMDAATLLSSGSDSENSIKEDDEEEDEADGCRSGPDLENWTIPSFWGEPKGVDLNDPNWLDQMRARNVREHAKVVAEMQELDYGVFPEGGCRPRNHEVWNRYLKQLEESENYDMKDFAGITMLTAIVPVLGFFDRSPSSNVYKLLVELATLAIQDFNKENASADPYEFHELLTANLQTSGLYWTFYITFRANKKNPQPRQQEEEEAALTTFQAKASKSFSTGEVQVHQCRIKEFKYLPSFHLSPGPLVPPVIPVYEDFVSKAERRKYDLNRDVRVSD